jgi:hypothetical protein
VHKIFDWKIRREEPIGRPMRRREGNIRMNLREIVWEVVEWIHLAQNKDQWQALVNMVMNLRGSVKGRKFLD